MSSGAAFGTDEAIVSFPGKIMTTVQQECPNCKGSTKCPKCDGTGLYRSWATIIVTLGVDKDTCKDCWSTGVCRRCKGTGLIPLDG